MMPPIYHSPAECGNAGWIRWIAWTKNFIHLAQITNRGLSLLVFPKRAGPILPTDFNLNDSAVPGVYNIQHPNT
jgi:hypothetical protein